MTRWSLASLNIVRQSTDVQILHTQQICKRRNICVALSSSRKQKAVPERSHIDGMFLSVAQITNLLHTGIEEAVDEIACGLVNVGWGAFASFPGVGRGWPHQFQSPS